MIETGVGTGTYVALTSLNDQVANDTGVVDRCEQDFGDLPSKYGMTTDTDNGANHVIVSGLQLGPNIDTEYTGVASATANADDNAGSDDEDGWQNVTDTLFNSDTGILEFQVLNSTGQDAYLTLFIDANDNGVFDSAEIVVDTVPSQITPQTRNISFVVPSDVIQGNVNMRVRLTTEPGIGPDGTAPDGEVEDYGGIAAIPVELISLTAEIVGNDDVLVKWSTATELINEGFDIERRMEGETEFTPIGFESGNGTTNSISEYAYTDNQNTWSSNIAYYRLKQIDFDGKFAYSDAVAVVKKGTVDAIVYPNPTKSVATISIMADAKRLNSSIVVRDIYGAEVTGDVDIRSNNGTYVLGTKALRNGTYFVELVVNNQKIVKKLMVTR